MSLQYDYMFEGLHAYYWLKKSELIDRSSCCFQDETTLLAVVSGLSLAKLVVDEERLLHKCRCRVVQVF